MRNADNITKGWGMAVVDKNKATKKNSDPAQNQYKAMWAEVVNVIAKTLDTFDQDQVRDAIKADRDNITAEMSASLPKPAVVEFIDKHFDTVWYHLSDPRGTTRHVGRQQGLQNEAYELRLIAGPVGSRLHTCVASEGARASALARPHRRTSCPPSGGPVTVRLKPDTTDNRKPLGYEDVSGGQRAPPVRGDGMMSPPGTGASDAAP